MVDLGFRAQFTVRQTLQVQTPLQKLRVNSIQVTRSYSAEDLTHVLYSFVQSYPGSQRSWQATTTQSNFYMSVVLLSFPSASTGAQPTKSFEKWFEVWRATPIAPLGGSPSRGRFRTGRLRGAPHPRRSHVRRPAPEQHHALDRRGATKPLPRGRLRRGAVPAGTSRPLPTSAPTRISARDGHHT